MHDASRVVYHNFFAVSAEYIENRAFSSYLCLNSENLAVMTILIFLRYIFLGTGSARERFQKGEVFRENEKDKPATSTTPDVRCAELSSFRDRFERGEIPDSRQSERSTVDVHVLN